MNFTTNDFYGSIVARESQGGYTMNTKGQNKQIGALMKDFVSSTIDFYNHMDSYPVCPPVNIENIHLLEAQPIPHKGRPLQDVYTEMLSKIYSSTLLGQHPRSFACVPSTESLLSWMGDTMTNAWNPHASCTVNAPAADLIEKKLIRWMCDLAGYPKESGGLFVSGGSIANLTALTAARDAKLTHNEYSRGVAYVSDQTHSSVAKGLHIIGFSRDQIRVIPSDASFAMDISALKAAIIQDINAHKIPFAVIASAGTTNTGTVDPLPQISHICRKYHLWMHVDGAFGASALVSKQCRKNLSGIHLSDSLSWDAHKWLLQTYGCSVVLVRDKLSLAHSFSAHPEYLKDAQSSDDSIEFWDLGPELTRPARSLKLWLTLQVMGTDAMGKIIDHGCALAQLAQNLIQQSSEWEVVSPAQLGIVNFRYISHGNLSGRKLDRINQNIAREITQSGFAQIFTTELCGKKVLRMCTIHPETTEQDIYDTIRFLKNTAAVKESSLTARTA